MNEGELVANFALPDQHGTRRELAEFLASGPVVLFFYPAAMTSGCTAENCHFRDLADAFTQVGAQRLGISPDPPAKQQRFTTAHDLDFPLLSDSDGSVAERFGVRRRFGPLRTRRHTFVIDTDRTLLAVIKSELRMNQHADQALAVLRGRSHA